MRNYISDNTEIVIFNSSFTNIVGNDNSYGVVTEISWLVDAILEWASGYNINNSSNTKNIYFNYYPEGYPWDEWTEVTHEEWELVFRPDAFYYASMYPFSFINDISYYNDDSPPYLNMAIYGWPSYGSNTNLNYDGSLENWVDGIPAVDRYQESVKTYLQNPTFRPAKIYVENKYNDTNLGNTLTINTTININSGDIAWLDPGVEYSVKTNYPITDTDNYNHHHWNNDLDKYKLQENITVDYGINFFGIFENVYDVSFNSNISVDLSIEDPWWVDPSTNLQHDPAVFHTPPQNNPYQVFRNQEPDQGPHYRLKAPPIDITQNDIFIFDSWIISPSNGATLNTGSSTTTVVFHDVGSPVAVTANYISANAAGQTVVIGPDEELVLPAGGHYNIVAPSPNMKIEIHGRLLIEGTPENPVVIQSRYPDGSPGGWWGIEVHTPNPLPYGSEENLSISNAVIKDAYRAISFQDTPSNYCAVVNVEKTLFQDNYFSLYQSPNDIPIIVGINQCTFVNTPVAIYAEGENGGSCNTVTVRNSIITESEIYGDNLGIYYSDLYNVDDYGNVVIAESIDSDPLFVDPSGDDFHLQPGSPCIDAGDPNSPYDPDGTIADLGAYYIDAPPSAPTGFSISGSEGQNPTCSWSPNTELDLDGYKLYKDEGAGWALFRTLDENTTSYTDNSVTIGPGGRFSSNVCYKVSAFDIANQESSYSIPRCKPLGGVSKQMEIIPDEYALHAAFPNPFNPSTSIRFDLPERSMVNMVIYDVLGRTIKTLVQDAMEPGFHEIRWNGKDENGNPVSTGMYVYRFSAFSEESEKQFNYSNKLVLMK